MVRKAGERALSPRNTAIWSPEKLFRGLLFRGAILNRTYGSDKNLDISLLSLKLFGPIYYGPP